jgi:PadR family transcriptional regulator PadR
MTLNMLKVLSGLAEQPQGRFAGADIRRSTGLESGTLYPILARLENAGWVESKWEEVDPREAGRPRRRLYRITPTGEREASDTIAQFCGNLGAVQWAC